MTRLAAMSEKSWPKETGGILVGHYADDLRATITLATGPPRGSSRATARFRRSPNGLAKHLQDFWTAGHHYVGEWHYHPTEVAEASALDLRSLATIAKTPAYRCRNPILIIAARTSATNLSVAMYVAGSPTRIHQLTIESRGAMDAQDLVKTQ